jgi:hypothetical protein
MFTVLPGGGMIGDCSTFWMGWAAQPANARAAAATSRATILMIACLFLSLSVVVVLPAV